MRRKSVICCLLTGMLALGSMVIVPEMGVNAKTFVIQGVGSITENEQMSIDYSDTSKGYVKAKYKQSTSSKIKAQVKCPTGATYTYDLKAGSWGTFPLTEGDGSYTVSVFKNISGTSYSTVGSATFDVELSSPMAPYLSANQYVDYTSGTKCVKKAKSLCKSSKNEMDKVKKVYSWTIKYFKYDKQKAKTVKSGYLPELDKVYKAKKGICFDYASTMAAMLRSQGVPTKLVIGYAGTAYHAWISVYSEKKGWITNVIYFDGKNWNLMDPTFASSSNESKSVMEFIGDGSNYDAKYAY